MNQIQSLLSRYRQMVQVWINNLKQHIDTSKRTVVFFSYSATYHKQFGTLHTKFKEQNWNVINLKTIFSDDINFDKQAPTFILPNLTEKGFIEPLNLDFIDLILTTNITDIDFISKSAKAIYLSHDMFTGIVPEKRIKYIFLASSQAVRNIKKHYKNNVDYCLIKGGYPRLDNAIRLYNQYKDQKRLTNKKYILYAPISRNHYSYNMLDILKFDIKLIKTLLKKFEYNIIIKFHPIEYINNLEYINKFKKKVEDEKRIEFFNNTDSIIDAHIKSDLIITDMSDTAFTYSLTTLKPAIFYTKLLDNQLESSIRPISQIGFEVKSLKKLRKKIKFIIKKENKIKKQIKNFRKKNIYNLKNSEKYLLDNLDYILEDLNHPRWCYLK